MSVQKEMENTPEEMAEFFESRLDIYEEHQMNEIAGAAEFYRRTAELLPAQAGAAALDLGCGTGLELDFYYALNPFARVTCIDLSEKMLAKLRMKFQKFAPQTICGSYFSIPFGEDKYDAAVSVESLHHFSFEEKVPLYQKVHSALRTGGIFVLTDYLEDTEEESRAAFARRARLLAGRAGLYHIDTPLTVARESEALRQAGFSNVREYGRWNKTSILLAVR